MFLLSKCAGGSSNNSSDNGAGSSSQRSDNGAGGSSQRSDNGAGGSSESSGSSNNRKRTLAEVHLFWLFITEVTIFCCDHFIISVPVALKQISMLWHSYQFFFFPCCLLGA